MPTEEEIALYGLMVMAEETTTLAQTTIRELPAELTKQLTSRLDEIEKSTSSAQSALAALPLVVEQAERKMRSTGLRLSLFASGVCLSVTAVMVAGLWWWQSSLREEREALQTEIAGLKAAIQAEESTLAEMKTKTWGIKLTTFNDGARGIILPRGVKYERHGKIEGGHGVGLEGIILSK